MGTIYYLSATIFQQPVAEISHVVGRKPAFLLVLTFAAAGTVIAGTANSIAVLLAGRAFQGFANAGSVLSAIILTDLVPIQDRAIWLATQNAVTAIGLACGPIIGTAYIRLKSWVCIVRDANLSVANMSIENVVLHEPSAACHLCYRSGIPARV